MPFLKKSKKLPRRQFIKNASIIGSSLIFLPQFLNDDLLFANEHAVSANEKISIAIIGCGEQGNVLINALLRIHKRFGIQIVAICDIWDYKLNTTQRRLKANGQNVSAYLDYEDMLEKEKSLDAVFIATPDFCHAKQTIDCLNAGLHVYCEKMMARTIDEAKNMVQAARRTKKLLQIGHQRRSNPYYIWAKKEILPNNILGRITFANGQWNTAVSPEKKLPKKFAIRPEVLKRYGYENENHFANWRWYKKYSGGPISDLGAHQIDIFNWFLGRPTSVIATGGTDFYKSREWFDNVTCVLTYNTPEGIARASYQVLTTTSAGGGYFENFMGIDGTLKLSENTNLIRAYKEPKSTSDWGKYVSKKFLDANQNIESNTSLFDIRATASIPTESYSLPKEISFNGKTIHQPHIENFLNAIKGKTTLNCDAEEAFLSEAPIYRINEAVIAEKPIIFSKNDFIA